MPPKSRADRYVDNKPQNRTPAEQMQRRLTRQKPKGARDKIADEIVGLVKSVFRKEVKSSVGRKATDKDSHAALKVVSTAHGPMLERYVAKGAKRVTAMHNTKLGGYRAGSLDDGYMVPDGVEPEPSRVNHAKREAPAGAAPGADAASLHYFLADHMPRVSGTAKELAAWFTSRDKLAMAISIGGHHSDPVIAVEVRAKSWARKGSPDYVYLGGAREGILTAAKQAISIGAGAVVGSRPEGAAQSTAEGGEALHHGVEQGNELAGEPRPDADLTPWDRATARKRLDFEVLVHGGAADGEGEVAATASWPATVQTVVQNGRPIQVGTVEMATIAAEVPKLIDKVLDEFDRLTTEAYKAYLRSLRSK